MGVSTSAPAAGSADYRSAAETGEQQSDHAVGVVSRLTACFDADAEVACRAQQGEGVDIVADFAHSYRGVEQRGARRDQLVEHQVLRCHKAKPFAQVNGLTVQLPPPNTVTRRGTGDR